MKNAIDSYNSRLNSTEEIIYELEDRSLDIISSGKNKEIRMKNSKESLHELWETIKRNNICIMRGERKERERDRTFMYKIMAEIFFPNLGRDMAIQLQEDYSQQYCIINFGDAKRLDLNCSQHTKNDKYVTQ